MEAFLSRDFAGDCISFHMRAVFDELQAAAEPNSLFFNIRVTGTNGLLLSPERRFGRQIEQLHQERGYWDDLASLVVSQIFGPLDYINPVTLGIFKESLAMFAHGAAYARVSHVQGVKILLHVVVNIFGLDRYGNQEEEEMLLDSSRDNVEEEEGEEGSGSKNLEKLTYAELKERYANFDDEICSICLKNFEDEEGILMAAVLAKTPCSHVFHDPCLAEWLKGCRQNKRSCPMCRFELSSSC